MLRVAIDARRLQDEPLYGVGRGLANLIPHLIDNVDVVLLCDDRRAIPSVPGCDAVALPGLGRLPEVAWRQISVARWLRRNRIDVIHGPYNALPLATRTPSVVTLHDLAWEHHPEDYSSKLRHAVIRTQARQAARKAQMIVTVSQFIRRAIMETYSIEADRVCVAPNSVDPIFHPSQAEIAAPLLKAAGVTHPYVVALGGARRRGLPVAVDAWRRATGNPASPSLVVVGVERPPQLEGVYYLGRLDDRSWAAVLAGALAFCYPTRYEGFGMPALEAAASGTPVVCARTGPLPEVLRHAAEWCDEPTVADISRGLSRLIDDPQRRATLAGAGLEVARTAPTWVDSARALLEVYSRAHTRVI